MPFFAEAAQELLDAGDRTPQQLLSMALAAVSGMTEAPKPRSLITMEEGAMTVLLREGKAGDGNADDEADEDAFIGRYRPSISSARDVVRVRLASPFLSRFGGLRLGLLLSAPRYVGFEFVAYETETAVTVSRRCLFRFATTQATCLGINGQSADCVWG
jgi:hypothetical protein